MKLLLLSEFFPASENGEISGGVEARNFFLAKYFKGEIPIGYDIHHRDKNKSNKFRCDKN